MIQSKDNESKGFCQKLDKYATYDQRSTPKDLSPTNHQTLTYLISLCGWDSIIWGEGEGLDNLMILKSSAFSKGSNSLTIGPAFLDQWRSEMSKIWKSLFPIPNIILGSSGVRGEEKWVWRVDDFILLGCAESNTCFILLFQIRRKLVSIFLVVGRKKWGKGWIIRNYRRKKRKDQKLQNFKICEFNQFTPFFWGQIRRTTVTIVTRQTRQMMRISNLFVHWLFDI